MKYNLWFPVLGLLFMPFIPQNLITFPNIITKINTSFSNAENTTLFNDNNKLIDTANPFNDFAISINDKTPYKLCLSIFTIWIFGVLIMITHTINSKISLHSIKKSAIIVQNKNICKLYKKCLDELKITTDIPIFCTAFLQSPVITGLLKPSIYIPLNLISEYNETDMRYILLHELQHHKHKDCIVNFFMNIIRILYWFNPLIRYALNSMRNDREIACDTSVMLMLKETEYKEYGKALINIAEKFSLSPFPFVTGISSNTRQLKKRIINISTYKKPSFFGGIKSGLVFINATAILFCIYPNMSFHIEEKHYNWKTENENISLVDLSAYFNDFKGGFVLYDSKNNKWKINNLKHATLRTSPNSTYKIYCALFGLEENIITPKNSTIVWDKTDYQFEEWNKNHNLDTAMQASVNWYFQSIDRQLKMPFIKKYIHSINYGNENTGTDISNYWLQSSLKISPIEQVLLLKKLFNNNLIFSSQNIDAVKKSLLIASDKNCKLYGKTGTGQINGNDINGWFIGCVATNDNTYFFATNISSEENATGSRAAEITLSVLHDMALWN